MNETFILQTRLEAAQRLLKYSLESAGKPAEGSFEKGTNAGMRIVATQLLDLLEGEF